VNCAVDSARVLETLLAAVKADDSATRFVTVPGQVSLPVSSDDTVGVRQLHVAKEKLHYE